MIAGIVFFDCWTTEMASLFFGSTLLIGILDRMSEKEFVAEFLKCAESLLAVALIIGLARGATIVLNDGLVTDSILFYASNVVQHFPAILFIVVLFLFYHPG